MHVNKHPLICKSAQMGSKQIISTQERHQVSFSENISSVFTDSQTSDQKPGSIMLQHLCRCLIPLGTYLEF